MEGGHLSLGTMILTVEPGRGGWWGGGGGGGLGWSYLSLGTIPTVEPGRGDLSLGTMILTVESGRVVARNKILGVDRGREGSFVSRNNCSNCRTWGGGSLVSFKV